MSKSLIAKISFLFIIMYSALWGCAAPQKVQGPRFFWPPLPATPRIEWIGSYASYKDFNRYRKSFWAKFLGDASVLNIKRPWGIAASRDGKVYVADTMWRQVLVFDMVAEEVYILGNGRYNNLFDLLLGIAVDSSGNIYASDAQKNQIFTFTKDGKPLGNIGDETLLSWPAGLAVDDERNRLYVANNHHHNIAVFDLKGKHLFDFSGRGSKPGYLNFPTDVDIDSKGNIVVADSMNARVQIFTPEGTFIRTFGKRGDGICDFEIMKGLAVNKATDNIYVSDGRGNDFKIFNNEGGCLMSLGGSRSVGNQTGVAPGGFLLPQDIDIDEEGKIYIIDSLNGRFQVFKVVDEKWLKERPIKDFGTKIE